MVENLPILCALAGFLGGEPIDGSKLKWNVSLFY